MLDAGLRAAPTDRARAEIRSRLRNGKNPNHRAMYKIIGADGNEYGPVSADQLRQWITEGRVNAQTRVLPVGEATWRTAAEVPELAALLSGPVPPTAAPQPPPLSALPSYTPAQRTNPLAIASLVCGILATTVCMCCCYGLPFNLVGVILGLIALSQINNAPGREGGKGIAIAGLVLSLLSIAFAIGMFILGFALNFKDIISELEKM